jgi:hypothetical protein
MGGGNSASADTRAVIASTTNFVFRRVTPIGVADVRLVGTEDRLIRIAGADRPIDALVGQASK